jgi:hypothetical protein
MQATEEINNCPRPIVCHQPEVILFNLKSFKPYGWLWIGPAWQGEFVKKNL